MAEKLAIVNYRCYSAKKNAYAKCIIDRLKRELGAELAFTEHPGHAEEIARDSSHYEIIIVAGGDGTVSEVVNGINLETQTLAIMPLGTGNNLAQDLGLISPVNFMDIIKKNEKTKIDLISCRFKINGKECERYVVTTSGIGFVSSTVTFANQYLKMARSLCYPLSACFRLFNQEVISAKVQIDNASINEITFTNFIINNTKHAGNVCIFPGADFSDSLLNLLFTRMNAFTQNLWNIGIITKTYFYYPGVRTANKLHISLKEPSCLMLDGEIFNAVEEIDYSVVPKKLAVFK